MTLHLVEAYGQEQTVEVQGRTHPVPCLLEDDDGLRWFVAPGFFNISAHTWARAAANGAAALAAPYGDGWVGCTVEYFMEYRHDSQGSYTLISGLVQTDDFPAYDQVWQVVEDRPGGGFVHLHTHSEYSALDGRSKISEIVAQARADDQPAVAVTDHGYCSGHPELQKQCDAAGIKPIFGIEAYFVNDRLRRPRQWYESSEHEGKTLSVEEYQALTAKEKTHFKVASDAKEVRDYYHLVLLAKTQEGLYNLWAASTQSHRDGFHYYPRMDWEVLREHREGLICTTGCLRGPLAKAILDDDEGLARENLGRLLDIFGDDLFIELHANTLPEQKKVNEALVALSVEHSVPLVAVVDSHYPTKDAVDQHRAWIAVQTNEDLQNETDLFSHDIGLYMQTEAEVRANLSYLPESKVDEAINATVRIAEQCEARIEAKPTIPIFSKKGGQERDEERLLDLCLSNWDLTVGPGKPSQEEYERRFEHEFPMIAAKGFCGYFLQVADYVRHSKDNGVLVGPGRGSGGGSLVAYLARITGLDPVEAQLLFERFMTEGRTALPDFDVDFPTSKRFFVQDYITGRYGEDHVVRVGTHLRPKNKGIIKDLGRAMKGSLPETAWKDLEAVSKIIGEAEHGTAGLGLSWEELWAQEGDLLQPYADRYPDVFNMSESLVGLLKSYGKHPAGLIVSEERLVDRLPLRSSGNEHDQMISQWDMKALEDLGYIKFDILTLRTLDTIQECVDLIEQRRGHRINMEDWKEEYLDPQVWDEISAGHTLGIFQVETASGVRMCKQMQPQTMAEFADALTLVRPGPSRSGLRDLYLARRSGIEPVSFPDPRLEQVLAKTYGCLLYQEDIMATCMVLAGYDSTKADEVRKILGKKQVEKVYEAGREFIEGCVENGMEREAAAHLWDQMAEFAKYSFNRAHAYGYAVLAYWTAWLKVHYPVEFFTSILSTVKQERIPEFVTEARRLGLKVLPPDINESGHGFKPIELGVRYGLDSIKGVGEAAMKLIAATQPFTSFEDFRERAGVDSGKTATLARVGAFDSLVENRRGLEKLLLDEKTGDATKCVFKDETVSGPNGLPCTFDWDNEPEPVNPRTGKKLKRKPIVKRCTKGCRNYTKPEPLSIDTIAPYTAEDIRDIEMEMLGIYLSSTPFDAIEDPVDRELLQQEAAEIEDGPQRDYLLAAIITKARKHKDQHQREMGFLTLVTEKNDLDVTVFSKTWERYKANLRVGTLAIVEVTKNNRGYNLLSFMPVT